MTRKSLKIGRYTEEEIFQYMTDVEGSMLGRSMYDAIFGTIHALITEKNQLKKDNETLQKHCRTAEKLQRENKSLKDQVTYLRRSIERKEEQYVLAQSKIDEAVDFIKEHITETEYRYVYSKTINVVETLELNNAELIELLEILERADK